MKASYIYKLLIVIIIGDVLSTVMYNLKFSFFNVGALLKTPIELVLLMVGALYLKRYQLTYWGIALLSACWLAGISVTLFTIETFRYEEANFLNDEDMGNAFLTSFSVLNRYFIFFSFAPFVDYFKNEKNFASNLRTLFEGFIIINSIAIFTGFIFKINFFSSYNPQGFDQELRFGYKGLLNGINEITGVYFLAIAHFYREIFYYKRKKWGVFILVVGAALLTGTKGCILAFILLTAYFTFRYRLKLFLWIIVPLILVGISYLSLDFVDQVILLANVYLPTDSLITIIMTKRDLYIVENFHYMLKNWSFLNFIFGDGVLYSETDLIDLYYCFGIGALLYLLCYLKLVFKIDQSRDVKYVVLLLLLMAFTGGHIIRTAVFPIFFLLFLTSGGHKPTLSENAQ